jgi:hypothetical protein
MRSATSSPESTFIRLVGVFCPCHIERIADRSMGGPGRITEPDGLRGEITDQRRPLKDGELMEWILLNGVRLDRMGPRLARTWAS